MNPMSVFAREIVALMSLGLAGCGAVETPSFFKSGAAGPPSADQTSAEGSSGSAKEQNPALRPKEITKVAPLASIMLEKNCPNIVQPYRMTDNFASVIIYGAKQGIESLGKVFSNVIGTGHAGSVNASEIPASVRLAAKQLNWLPMNVEQLYGERSHRQETNLLARESKLGKKYYPVADNMLADVLAKIGEPHDYKFKLFIQKNSTHNALSRPGGYIYVDQGLVDDPDEYAKARFAIAHEVSHVLQRHETKGLQSMIVDSFTLQDEMKKVISSAGSQPEVALAHVKTGKNLFIRHHIDQELQADACAARLLSHAFPDRAALADSITAFLKELPKPGPPVPVRAPTSDVERLEASIHDVVETPIKAHPNSLEREHNLRAMYNEIVKDPISSSK